MTEGESAPVTLPAGLRDRVLAASRHARTTGHRVPAREEISPAEAFSRAADALHELLRALTDQDWRQRAVRGLDVQSLVGHLIGVEEDMHRCLSGDPAVAQADHIESTQAAAVRQAGRPPDQTRAQWRRATDRTRTLVRACTDPDAEFAVHGMRRPIQSASGLSPTRSSSAGWSPAGSLRPISTWT